MGTYLSTPVTEKHQEEGQSRGGTMRWGVVDMQGWRKTMEDAHIAQTDVPLQIAQDSGGTSVQKAHVFGVFDGHGGPEVARFTALYLVSVLQQQLKQSVSPEGSNMGLALVETFHALDRMIDDAARRDEMVKLKTLVPAVAAQRQATKIPPKPVEVPAVASAEATPVVQAVAPTPVSDVTPSPVVSEVLSDSTVDTASSQKVDSVPNETLENPTASPEGSDDSSASLDTAGSEDTSGLKQDVSGVKQAEEGLEVVDGPESTNSENVPDISTSTLGTDPSSAFLAPQPADSEAVAPVSTNNSAAGKVSGMLQRLLKLSTPSSGVVLQVGKHGLITSRVVTPNVPTASKPTIVRNGQMMCNLPDHPIHAGATAIVAVVCDNTLVVANAGDSRAVLCRGGGVTVALSFDHKPMQATELARIRAAGGFVNAFGRVNGNLNLSRSVGDLKYKQVPGIPPALQMITAEPDIMELTLCDADEFIILGCDGIWDCLTNEKAVEFVRSRIQEKSPTEIGVEMLKSIISDDPRTTQGIGGDNMTIMIVDLQPNLRNYERLGSSVSTATVTK